MLLLCSQINSITFYYSCYAPAIVMRVIDLEIKHIASSLKKKFKFYGQNSTYVIPVMY